MVVGLFWWRLFGLLMGAFIRVCPSEAVLVLNTCLLHPPSSSGWGRVLGGAAPPGVASQRGV